MRAGYFREDFKMRDEARIRRECEGGARFKRLWIGITL
jgi:hypothetical protein